jgi:RimJ/RimL family protein N-acetyltransferase
MGMPSRELTRGREAVTARTHPGPARNTLNLVIELRALVAGDLSFVAAWLRQPHVARWWLAGTTAEAELEEIAAWVAEPAASATRLLTIVEPSGAHPEIAARIGWCQWYPYDAYPAEAESIGARAGDCGIDYAIGDPAAIGRGFGTEMIASLVEEVRQHNPGCGVIAGPDARNVASRRVLERNGFSLISVRAVASEPTDDPVAIYRLGRDTQAPGI